MAAKDKKAKGRRESASFSVDTQLFRELGELLVARDATALLELVKNSYDADARVVIVDGQDLGSRRKGVITVTDDGNGMTLAEFRRGFLRLAGRSKTGGTRRSPRYGRRYTGEKGVGRLATHKLARVLDVNSVPRSRSKSRRAISAHLDWRELEKRSSLEEAGEAVTLRTTGAGDRPSGTEIQLGSLRHAWSDFDRAEFVSGAEAYSPPQDLVGATRLQELMKPDKPLFRVPRVRDRRGGERDPGFQVRLTGDFGFSGDFWDEMVESVEWVLEMSADRTGVEIAVVPTDRERAKTNDQAKAQRLSVAHPDPKAGPFFQARILARGRRGSKAFRAWSEHVAGVRVYSEGFRVLPYGEQDNDWLQINREYAARSRKLRVLEEREELASEMGWTEEDHDLALTLLPADSYVGAIFLTRERSGQLEMLVNREGFVENAAFANLVDLTRVGISVLARARAAGRLGRREAARAERDERRKERASEPEESEVAGSHAAVGEALRETRDEIAALRSDLASGDSSQLEARIERLEEWSGRLEEAVSSLLAEQRLMPILASVGIQMGEFIHEINGLLAMTSTIDTVLGRLRRDRKNFPTPAARRDAAEIHQEVTELRARLERQATYLIDLTAPGAVRRRSRQRLAERFDRAVELVRPALERRSIKLANRIPDDARTQPMFPAELTAVLLNLLTNAIKAAGEGGKISASARMRQDGTLLFQLQNTGAAVDLEMDPERWFRPFETTTTDVDPLLGQGMGFGLPITRDILDEYGASIKFVRPLKGYATAIAIEFPS
jgi:signal transduction histidine kinase